MTSATSLLSTLQRVLLATDGTVTHILEAYADEPIDVVKLGQDLDAPGEGDAPLGVPPDARLLRRTVLLTGRTSGRRLLYAEAVVVTERIPLDFLDSLLTTDEPIGRLLARRRMETFREILSVATEAAGTCARHFGIEPAAELLTRTYRIVVGGEPIMLITEKFPAKFFVDLAA